MILLQTVHDTLSTVEAMLEETNKMFDIQVLQTQQITALIAIYIAIIAITIGATGYVVFFSLSNQLANKS
jgi:hypothetical protein